MNLPDQLRSRDRQQTEGFTFLELLALLAVLAFLILLHLPAVANTAHRSKSSVCLSNFRELSVGWINYADDHQGILPHNLHGSAAMGNVPSLYSLYSPWAVGWLDWNPSIDSTNILKLIDPRYAKLAPYIRPDPSLFKCPEDTLVSPALARSGYNRVRSYSMNFAMGDGNDKWIFAPSAQIFIKLADIVRLKPADAFVFLEEHPDSINDPLFFVRSDSPQWIDLPSSLHQGSCAFSFADGSVSLKHWLEPTTIVPVRFNFGFPLVSSNDRDLAWVRAHSFVPR